MLGSPTPQGYAQGPAVVPVRIVHGFTSGLPGRDRLFFQRIYFAEMPRPIQRAPGNAYPHPITVATIEAPKNQCIVLRAAAFRVFQHSGIGVNDFVETPPSRTVSYFGFELRIGNRSLTDFNTNISPIPTVPVGIGNGGGNNNQAQANAQANLSPGTGQFYPFSGIVTPNLGGEPFASYVRPGDQIVAKLSILREPNFDVRFFSVELSGWLANEADLDRMVNMLSG